MLVIELSFPAGRFHATPWGRHVNEGVPEWPPSPYRLLRALYDTWKRKRSDWPDARVRPLLAALASRPPSFVLPPATASHTRSFLSENEESPTERKLVFDGFVSISPRTPVLVGWPELTLDPQAETDLDELLSCLNYFGRSESWVAARVASGITGLAWNCTPASTAHESKGLEAVRVACAKPAEDYEAQPHQATATRGKKRTSQPVPWLEALAWSTGRMLDEKLSEPPALRFIPYLRSPRCFQAAMAARPARREPVVHGVLYALETKVPPPVTATLEIAERARRKLMGIHARLCDDRSRVSPTFSGKDPDGKPLTGHVHAYYLPQDRDRDGRLDHLLVIGQQPLDQLERLALDQLNSLWQSDGKPDIRLIPIQWGTRDELLSPTKRVTSATPFIPPRHHRSGRGELSTWLVAELEREARNHHLPTPVGIAPLSRLEEPARSVRWLEFRRNRKGDRAQVGYGFTLEFAEAVPAPFALGYGAHFGLGLFVSANELETRG